MYFYNNYSLKSFFLLFFYEEWVRAFSHRGRWIRESLYTGWPSTLISCGQPRRVAVKELKLCSCVESSVRVGAVALPLLPRSCSLVLALLVQHGMRMKGKQGVACFLFHTGPKQSTCQRKTGCFLPFYLISFPASSISKLSESSDVL